MYRVTPLYIPFFIYYCLTFATQRAIQAHSLKATSETSNKLPKVQYKTGHKFKLTIQKLQHKARLKFKSHVSQTPTQGKAQV